MSQTVSPPPLIKTKKLWWNDEKLILYIRTVAKIINLLDILLSEINGW